MRTPCTRCGRDDLPLVLAEGGSICGLCESDAADAEAADRARWVSAILPLLALVGGTVSALAGCVPLIGLVSAPLGALLAVVAIAAGVRNFLIDDAEDLQRTALIVSGGLGLLGGLLLLPLALYLGFIAILGAV